MNPNYYSKRRFILAFLLLSFVAGCIELNHLHNYRITPMIPTRVKPSDQRGKQLINLGNQSIATLHQAKDSKQELISEAYGKLPLSFEVNEGQANSNIKFLSRGKGYSLFLTSAEAMLILSKASGSKRKSTIKTQYYGAQEQTKNPESLNETRESSMETCALRMKLIGANPSPQVDGLDQLPGKSHYLIGNDPDKWHRDISNYSKVIYREAYPGIDVVYYGNQRELEYDFLLAPGVDPRIISVAFDGVQEIRISKTGDLLLRTPLGDVRQNKPQIYQEQDGRKREIFGHYIIKSENQIGFEVGEYDTKKPLVIDPMLVYSSYLGGSGSDGTTGFDYIGGIAVDPAGNAYVTGVANSNGPGNFPTTPGAFQTTYGGGFGDAFVAKINPTGTALIYSTYLGGISQDVGFAIATDTSGSAYITGSTQSNNFPITPGAFKPVSSGVSGFVTKLSPNGSSLIYSTFLAGETHDAEHGIVFDKGRALAVDGSGNAYITGTTTCVDFPTTPGAFQRIYGGKEDSFVTKLNATGTALVYSTYLGGNGNTGDRGYGITVDSTGSVYIAGQTDSANFPTVNPIQFSLRGSYDAFVTKLNATGTALVYSTYLGGNGGDFCLGVAIDLFGNAHVMGLTFSADFPTTPGAFQTSFNGGNYDYFVTKLNATGTALVYSTYLGGSGNEGLFGGSSRGGIAVDLSGNAYVTGNAVSSDFPTTPGAYQTFFGGGSDAFLTKFNLTGTSLIYSSFLGGSSGEAGANIAVDSAGNAYLTGWCGPNFPVTAGAFQATPGGSQDAFIAKLSLACAVSCSASVPATATIGSNVSFTATSTLSACTGSPNYDWNFGDSTAHSSQQNPSHTYTAVGAYRWTLIVRTSEGAQCVKTGTIRVDPPSQYCLTTSVPTGGGSVSRNPAGPCYNRGSSVIVTAQPTAGYRFDRWSGDISSFTNPIMLAMNSNKTITANFVLESVPLSGDITMWDGQKYWKLNGDSISDIEVKAVRVADGVEIATADIDEANARYSFSSLPPDTYNLKVKLNYTDIGINNTSSIHNGCNKFNFDKTTYLQKNDITVPSTASQDIVFHRPVVMAHGYWSCYQKWHNFDSARDADYWDNYLRNLGRTNPTGQNGFITITPNYWFQLDDIHSWPRMAVEVKDQVEQTLKFLTRQANNNSYPLWNYVGHSQGGLVGRVLTSGDFKDSPLITSLRKMFLLGTPNSGSFWAAAGNKKFLSEDTIERKFNFDYPSFGGKNVKVFAGDYNRVYRNAGSDSVVDVDSVYYIKRKVCVDDGFLRPTCTTDAGDPLPGETLSYYHQELGSKESLNQILSDRLISELASVEIINGSTSLVDSSSQQSRVGLNTIAVDKGIISTGETSTRLFTVGATDLIVANTVATAGSASFSLIDPSGQAVDFDSLPPTAGNHTISEYGDVFTVSNPVPGIWGIRAIAGTPGADFDFVAAENSVLGFQGFITSQTLTAGQAAHLISQWAGDATGVSSPSVSAKVVDETDTLIGMLTLFDDGAHGDGDTGDGVFGGDTPALSNAGRYIITFTAEGVLNSQPFMRWAEASIDVIASTQLFTGNFNDGAFDSDQDDVYDTLQETVVVNVPDAGNYIVAADLEDGQGYFIDHAVGSLEVTASGAYSVSLNFKMSGVFCSQFNSPFSIKNLSLSEAGSLKVLDIWNGNVTTQTYDSVLFDCAKGTPAPAINSVQPGALFPGQSRQVIISGNSFANGAQVSFGSGITVSSVTFGSSSTLLAQISTAAGATPGPRDVTVTNPDGRTVIIPGLFSVASDQPPAVLINNISDQQEVTGVVTVSATAADDLGIQKVEFYLDGVLSATDTSFPYQFVWGTSGLSNGPHTIAAKAYDTANNTATSQITAVVSCVSTLSPSRFYFQARGGSGTLNVTSPSLCSWSLLTNDNWIVVTSAELDSGNAIVTFEVRENLSANARTGILTVGARMITVTQNGLGVCQYAISPTFGSFSTNGGTGILQIIAGQGCAWQAITRSGWITITSSSTGIGSGTLTYSVGPNPGPTGRSGTITVGGKTFSIKQKGT